MSQQIFVRSIYTSSSLTLCLQLRMKAIVAEMDQVTKRPKESIFNPEKKVLLRFKFFTRICHINLLWVFFSLVESERIFNNVFSLRFSICRLKFLGKLLMIAVDSHFWLLVFWMDVTTKNDDSGRIPARHDCMDLISCVGCTKFIWHKIVQFKQFITYSKSLPLPDPT